MVNINNRILIPQLYGLNSHNVKQISKYEKTNKAKNNIKNTINLLITYPQITFVSPSIQLATIPFLIISLSLLKASDSSELTSSTQKSSGRISE